MTLYLLLFFKRKSNKIHSNWSNIELNHINIYYTTVQIKLNYLTFKYIL